LGWANAFCPIGKRSDDSFDRTHPLGRRDLDANILIFGGSAIEYAAGTKKVVTAVALSQKTFLILEPPPESNSFAKSGPLHCFGRQLDDGTE
jgi:hypothetical protein